MHVRTCVVSICLCVEPRVVQNEADIPGQENMREWYSEVDCTGVYSELLKLVYLDMVYWNLHDMFWTVKIFQKFESSSKVWDPLLDYDKIDRKAWR